jgi:hypothetical protein
MSSLPPNNRQDKPTPILAVVTDRDIELYGNISPTIITRPHCSTPAGEAASDEYVLSQLPRCLKDLYWPSNRVAIVSPSRMTAEDLAWRHVEQGIIESVERLTKQEQEAVECRWFKS